MATGQQGPPTRPRFPFAAMVRPPPPPSAPAPQPDQVPPPPSRPTIIIQPQSFRPPQTVVARATTEKEPPITSSPPKTEQIPLSTISNPPSPQPKYSYQQLPQETKVDHNNNRHVDKKSRTTINNKRPEDVGNGMTRRIIIAGENKGAIMDLRTHPLGKQMSTDSSGDSSDKSVASDSNNSKSNRNNSIKPPLSAVMNSNVQGVNNSILYNSSTTHHDPGLHLSLKKSL